MKLTALHPLATRIAAWFIYSYMRLVGSTSQVTLSGQSHWDQHVMKGRNIISFWHNRLFFTCYYYSMQAKKQDSPPGSILISMSRDGDYGAALVKLFKQSTVRGSSSRGGRRAVRELSEQLAQGYNIALTPDGPRGPREKAQKGAIRMGQLTGAPILPVSYDARRRCIFNKSWDHFILPLPFNRIHIAFGSPIEVDPNAQSPELEKARQELERALLDLGKQCQQNVNRQD